RVKPGSHDLPSRVSTSTTPKYALGAYAAAAVTPARFGLRCFGAGTGCRAFDFFSLRRLSAYTTLPLPLAAGGRSKVGRARTGRLFRREVRGGNQFAAQSLVRGA